MNSTRQTPEYVPHLVNFDAQLNELCTDALVLTPNNRLAEVLKNAFIQFQIDSGQSVWRTPQIRSFGNFVPLYYANLQHRWPDRFPLHLLNNAEQKLAWLSSSSELSSDMEDTDWRALSNLAMDGWSTLHEWDIDIHAQQFQLDDTSAFFQKWVHAFKTKLRNGQWLSPSEVPDIIQTALPYGCEFLPSRLVLYGFESETRQQSRLFHALEKTGMQVVRKKINDVASLQRSRSAPDVFQLPDEASELAHVAKWARLLVEKGMNDTGGTPRIPAIGIIVPDLERHHASIVRQFDSVFSPAAFDADPMLRSFNISGGIALNRSTVCSDALRLLRWTASALSPEGFESLRSSPYLDMSGLDGFDGSRTRPVSMANLNRRIESDFLRNVFTIEAMKSRVRRPLSDWSIVFTKILDLAHWPNSESLESVHFQAAERFNRILEEVRDDMDIVGLCDLSNAVRYIESIVAQVKFSPQSSPVPVQIMTVLEADGLRFDHVWLLGFDNRAWPANPVSKPFIPRSLLLEKEVPRSSLQSEHEFAERYISNLLEHSSQVNFSFVRYRGDEEFEISKLIKSKAEDIEILGNDSEFHPLAEAGPLTLKIYEDFQAPQYVPASMTKGGSGLLTDQSNCPFLAFAKHRMRAGSRPVPEAFPDALDRGNIVHKILELLFTRINNQEDLKSLSPEDRHSAVQSIVESCVTDFFSRFPVRFQQREKVRLTELVEQWIQVEILRPPYRVVGIEEELTCNVAGLHLNTRVDRIDIDEENGHRIIIDYKTGKVRVKDWGGERPGQPQLPLYALHSSETKTLFYAQVKDAECKYSGMSENYPAAKNGSVQILNFADLGADDWTQLRNNWHTAVEVLSREFQAGYAEVNPANRDMCKYCDFQALCRISAQEKPTHE